MPTEYNIFVVKIFCPERVSPKVKQGEMANIVFLVRVRYQHLVLCYNLRIVRGNLYTFIVLPD